ncbi:sensor domain-containing diguanylate cyclase [Hydrogenivirga caldilitoris]|uniref:sensor domain-containing diguanylate cyclase n=1 Tax=Hydrogenivirga caldilitoris TaxID=246264 RepID=UPI000EAB5164|nr:diguanylate cyclase [Hydrogenivirga caldilitoris]
MSERHYRELVENVNSIVLRWKPDGTISFINEYGSWFFEFRKEDLLGKNVLDTIVPALDADGKDLRRMIKDIVHDPRKYIYNENENVTSSGKRVFILWRNNPIFDEEGRLTEILSIGSDITDKRKLEKELVYMASHDSLTGVFNRREFERILDSEIQKANRYNEPLSLILFDVDNFKDINDSFGHNAGDGVLVEIASAVSATIREIDTFARLGGDEFVLLLPHTLLSGAVDVAEKIKKLVESVMTVKVRKVTTSVGVTVYRKGEERGEFLIRADRALYRAKDMGKNCVASL